MTGGEVWVVFEGHGYYADSIWTTREPALARATVVAAHENARINPDWRELVEGRYLKKWPLNTVPGDDQ